MVQGGVRCRVNRHCILARLSRCTPATSPTAVLSRTRHWPSSRVAAFESLGSEEIDAASPEFSVHLSHDTVLTALAQLAALRVGTDRAYISLIDDEHQVIIAEATPSISLQSKEQHDPGQQLHLGVLSKVHLQAPRSSYCSYLIDWLRP